MDILMTAIFADKPCSNKLDINIQCREKIPSRSKTTNLELTFNHATVWKLLSICEMSGNILNEYADLTVMWLK